MTASSEQKNYLSSNYLLSARFVPLDHTAARGLRLNFFKKVFVVPIYYADNVATFRFRSSRFKKGLRDSGSHTLKQLKERNNFKKNNCTKGKQQWNNSHI
jgi:hypothetical protein